MEEAYLQTTRELLRFIRQSPTAFQTAQTVAATLDVSGFTRLREGDAWQLTPGGSYYLLKNGSSVIAFRVPNGMPERILLSASHSDSPMLKLKEEAENSSGNTYLRLNTEVYGGTILSSWLDRPLSLAGRVILQKDGVFTVKPIAFDRDLLLIPNVAVHMNRQINEGYSYNPAVDLVPICAAFSEKGAFRKWLAGELGCAEEEIAGTDLYAVNRTEGRIWGIDSAFFSAPRIDNLMCAYGTLVGFCTSQKPETSLNVYYCADNEETGSETKQGAGSVFLSDVLERVCTALGCPISRLLEHSFLVSADNGHAVHPNHPEYSDPDNAPRVNGGIVIKTNAAQHYATDGLSAAIFEAICRRAAVPFQRFANRSDLRGGSTLGSIANVFLPVNTVDIGLAQLAMHSSYETAGCADAEYLIRAIRCFYECRLVADGEGQYRI